MLPFLWHHFINIIVGHLPNYRSIVCLPVDFLSMDWIKNPQQLHMSHMLLWNSFPVIITELLWIYGILYGIFPM